MQGSLLAFYPPHITSISPKLLLPLANCIVLCYLFVKASVSEQSRVSPFLRLTSDPRTAEALSSGMPHHLRPCEIWGGQWAMFYVQPKCPPRPAKSNLAHTDAYTLQHTRLHTPAFISLTWGSRSVVVPSPPPPPPSRCLYPDVPPPRDFHMTALIFWGAVISAL